jgi:hypothetical protein
VRTPKTMYRPTQLDLALMQDPAAKAAEEALRIAAGEGQKARTPTPWPLSPGALAPRDKKGDKAH